jgi:peptidoglycan hydrolase CwlO-like protein
MVRIAKLRLAFLLITLIAVVAAYFAYASYIQTKHYENILVEFDKRLIYANSRYDHVQEEERKLNASIDDLTNKINELNNKIRIQDALIQEVKVRSKRK